MQNKACGSARPSESLLSIQLENINKNFRVAERCYCKTRAQASQLIAPNKNGGLRGYLERLW